MSFDVRSVRGEPQISNRFGGAMICGLVLLQNAKRLRNPSHLVDRILRLVPAGIRSKRQPSAKSPGFKRQLRSTRPQAGAGHQRRQPLRRGAVPHRQIPARTRLRVVGCCATCCGQGHAFCLLIQPRSSPQRDPLRQSGTAPCRGRPRAAGGPSRTLPAGTRGQPKALERRNPRLDAGWRGDPQSRERHGRSGGDRGQKAFRFDRRACFPVPTWRKAGHGAERRGRKERSHPEPRAARPFLGA